MSRYDFPRQTFNKSDASFVFKSKAFFGLPQPLTPSPKEEEVGF
jgi:hypothetical protein